MQKIVFFIALVLFMINLGTAATVNVTVDVYDEKTDFTYTFLFSKDDSYKTFSMEKPSDSKIIYSIDKNDNPVFYNTAGDFYIFRPEFTENNIIYVKFESEKISNEVINNQQFSLYQNFNFLVETLNFRLNIEGDFGEKEIISPRDFNITNTQDLVWSSTNIENEQLYLVKFNPQTIMPDDTLPFYLRPIYIIGFSVFVLIIALIFLIGLFLKNGKIVIIKDALMKNNSNKNIKEKISTQIDDTIKTKTKINKNNTTKQFVKNKIKKPQKEDDDKKIAEQKFIDLTNKYLTDNEKDVVKIIKEHEGISQYDILNHMPSLTKSNLSKIISKLHSKQILVRIRVGKVNKIHLGDKLKFDTDKNDTNTDKKE